MITIRVINPNTTASMTETIREAAQAVAGPDTRIVATNPSMGPVSIESHYDEALASVGALDEVRQGEREGTDGYVLACFGDPGLHAAQELASGPVVGIAQAAFHAANLLGRSFAIVTTLSRTLGRARDLVLEYGFERRCVAYRACEVPVLGLDSDPDGAYRALLAECESTIKDCDPDVIVLGCAGMAGMCKRLCNTLHRPVIDGVAAGVTLVEGLVRMGAGTAKCGEFAEPPAKTITGLLAPFAQA